MRIRCHGDGTCSHGNGVMLDVGMGSFQRRSGHRLEWRGEERRGIVVVDARIVVDAGIGGGREAHASLGFLIARMTRGKQKIEAQKRSAERNEKPKGSQIEARNAGLKTVCSVCKAPLANYKQLVDHFGSKHPKEPVPPGPSS